MRNRHESEFVAPVTADDPERSFPTCAGGGHVSLNATWFARWSGAGVRVPVVAGPSVYVRIREY